MTPLTHSNPKRVPSDRELADYRSALATLTKNCLLRITALKVPSDIAPLCGRGQPGLTAQKL